MVKRLLNTTATLLQKYITPQSFWLLFFTSLVFNVLWMYFAEPGFNPDFSLSRLYVWRGDTIDYVNFAESFYTKGTWGNDGVPSDMRMPGFLLIYLPFRIFLSKHMTLNMIIVGQLILSAVAKYYTVKLAWKWFNNYWVFLLAFVFLNLSDVLSHYNIEIISESVATSLFIFGVYTLYKYWNSPQAKWLFATGLLFTAVFLLRPFMGVVFPMAVWVVFLKHRPEYSKLIMKWAVLLLPVIIVEAGWIIRNYNAFGIFQPLETSVTQGARGGASTYTARSNFVKNFGGNSVSWGAGNEGTWFQEEDFLVKNNVPRPPDDILPKTIFTPTMTLDKLKQVRFYDWRSKTVGVPEDSAKWYHEQAMAGYQAFSDTFKVNQPYQYYVGSRLAHFKILAYQPDSYFRSARYPVNVLLVFLNAFITPLIFILGFIGCFVALFKKKNPFNVFLVGVPLFLYVFMALVLQSSEGRQVLFAFPFFCLLSAWVITGLIQRYKAVGFVAVAGIVLVFMYTGFKFTMGAIKW